MGDAMRVVLKTLNNAISSAAENADSRDILLAAGLIMLGSAVATVSVAGGIGIVGAVLVGVAIFGVR